MAVEPITDGSLGFAAPELTRGMQFSDYGSYGLRQYSGWVREEFLRDLVGREAARVYREMSDNNPTIGSIIFTIKQAIRKVEWRVEVPEKFRDEPKTKVSKAAVASAQAEAEFVESLMEDMSHTWEDFVSEALSMLIYGFSAHEIVYKRRLGDRPHSRPGPKPSKNMAASKFNDGRIGWRRLPVRGQDTIIKWFFDENGQTQGLTQQPWVGSMIDIPIEKLLLFRPESHKNNPEGRSALRTAYRSYFFTKRLEEQEAIMMERFNGFPVLYVPSDMIAAGQATDGAGKIANPAAYASLQQYKKILTNIRVDEQMGALFPSDTYIDPTTGKPSNVRMYELQLLTPGAGGGAARGGMDSNKIIERYKLDMMMTVLADFIQMGHEVRGTNNLAGTKVDMFYAAIQGWVKSISSVLNRYGLQRIWEMNRLDPELMPEIVPDLPLRVDLDGLGAFIANLAASGMPLFPDEELQNFLREAGGMPEDSGTAVSMQETEAALAPDPATGQSGVKKMIFDSVIKRIAQQRGLQA